MTSTTGATEFAELHDLIGGLRRCVSSLRARYGDSPAMRRIVIDADRILSDVDLLDTDVSELDLAGATVQQSGEKIVIPDTQYDSEFWRDVDCSLDIRAQRTDVRRVPWIVSRAYCDPKHCRGDPLTSTTGTTEFAELHDLIGGLRRCVSSLRARYGDSPAMRRIVIDADRIMSDVDLLDSDVSELDLAGATVQQSGEKIVIPDTQYDSEFWRDVDDEGVGGHNRA